MDCKKYEFIENLYDDYSSYLYNIAIRITNNEDLALECVQETFLVALLKVTSLLEHPNKQAWLCKTLAYKIKELTRFHNKLDTSSINSENCCKDQRQTIIDKFSSYDTYFNNSERFELIEKLQSVLTVKEIEYIRYKYIEEFSNKEIAKKVGMSYTAVTSAGTRIHKKLKLFYKTKRNEQFNCKNRHQ